MLPKSRVSRRTALKWGAAATALPLVNIHTAGAAGKPARAEASPEGRGARAGAAATEASEVRGQEIRRLRRHLLRRQQRRGLLQVTRAQSRAETTAATAAVATEIGSARAADVVDDHDRDEWRESARDGVR